VVRAWALAMTPAAVANSTASVNVPGVEAEARDRCHMFLCSSMTFGVPDRAAPPLRREHTGSRHQPPPPLSLWRL